MQKKCSLFVRHIEEFAQFEVSLITSLSMRVNPADEFLFDRHTSAESITFKKTIFGSQVSKE